MIRKTQSYPILGILVLLVCLTNPVWAQDETLQNDSFVSDQPASFQAGFISGEIAAARFAPSIPCPCSIDSLTVLFGGNSDTVTMGIQIWDDPGGVIPGTLLYTGEVVMTGSTSNLQQIDLTTSPIVITRPFRVGLVFNHDGLPGVATDTDGTIDTAANFILADFGGLSLWFGSSDLGVSGDFIMRAAISDIDADGDGVTDALDNCVVVANGEQSDTDADGYGNLATRTLTTTAASIFRTSAFCARRFSLCPTTRTGMPPSI